jgi:hypothetical protein
VLRLNDRSLYLNELRSPDGYVLDKALGTTFTLDLLSLLVAPVSMVFYEAESSSAVLKDPTAVLEALRRVTGRVGIFCQQGRISVPSTSSLLYSYLEPAVIEVRPPRKNGVFHPKVWLLRFVGEELPVMYRFLCLSRNLTFDKSWDTVLCLEGTVLNRRYGIGRTKPLVDFVRSLPRLAVREVGPSVLDMVEQIAGEVARVRLEVPEGFSEFSFVPVGIPGYRRRISLSARNRLLVLSPFLTEDVLEPLAESGRGNVLISRAESLDGISDDALAAIKSRTSVYAMDEQAERPEEVDVEDQLSQDADDMTELDRAEADISGLHAKMYIAEDGWDARLLTGSANATTAAMGGANVEFMVELTGRRALVGINRFMGAETDKNAFRSLLVPYERTSPVADDEDAKIRKALEGVLERGRQALTEADLSLQVVLVGPDLYSMEMTGAAGALSRFPENTVGICFPITTGENAARALEPLVVGRALSFPNMSLVSLTGFVAFRLTASLEGRSMETSFVLNLPVRGMPEERDRQILLAIVSDEQRFIRYLLFLLADESDASLIGRVLAMESSQVGEGKPLPNDIPLLEELVRAYARDPERLTRIGRLVDDLMESDEGRKVIPEGFERVWKAVMQARSKGSGR